MGLVVKFEFLSKNKLAARVLSNEKNEIIFNSKWINFLIIIYNRLDF